MPSSMTKIWDDIQKKYIDYDMGKGFDTIDTSKAQSEADAAAAQVKADQAAFDQAARDASAAALLRNQTDPNYHPYKDMTPAQQAAATAAAVVYNRIVEAEANRINIERYGNITFKYPPAATIWNPNTGTKRAVKLDRMTGKILQADMDALPAELRNNWKLWTGGMASGNEARAAITGTSSNSNPQVVTAKGITNGDWVVNQQTGMGYNRVTKITMAIQVPNSRVNPDGTPKY
ncbi:MAG: hypothetical protein KKF08_18980 [Gammaproteobacteria bacterium]|nr:hypothetical protein [Gammaproteobacteria bacterium]